MNGTGPYTFRVHGQVCHRVGSLIPQSASDPVFSQIYIYDTQVALRERFLSNIDNNFKSNTLGRLTDLMLAVNPLAQKYKSLGPDLFTLPNQKLKIVETLPNDKRRYNAPTADEIAVILPVGQSENSRRYK